MALAKNSSPITQLTASGTSASVSVSGGIAPLVSLHHSNGSGAVTVAATAQVKYQVNGAARTYAPALTLVTFGTSSGQTEDRFVVLPDSVTSVQITYTAPTGPSSFTLDAEIASTTP